MFKFTSDSLSSEYSVGQVSSFANSMVCEEKPVASAARTRAVCAYKKKWSLPNARQTNYHFLLTNLDLSSIESRGLLNQNGRVNEKWKDDINKEGF